MSRRRTIDAYRLTVAGFVGFLAGVILTGYLLVGYRSDFAHSKEAAAWTIW